MAWENLVLIIVAQMQWKLLTTIFGKGVYLHKKSHNTSYVMLQFPDRDSRV